MNRDSLAKDKFYCSSYVNYRTSSQIQQIKQVPQTSESEIVVTVCLSSCEDCNGRYEDNTGQFKIQCHCNCHSNHDSQLEENKKHACHGSSQNKQKGMT
jgi:hypothetical protein